MNEKQMFQHVLQQERRIFSMERKLQLIKKDRDTRLREQGKVIESLKKEIKDLNSEIHDLEYGTERVKEDIEKEALKEKVEFVRKAFEDYDNYVEVLDFLHRCGVLYDG